MPVTQSGETASTGLAEMLRADGRRRPAAMGLALDYCVKAAALDAVAAGFATAVILEAIAAVNLRPSDGDRAVSELVAAGVAIL